MYALYVHIYLYVLLPSCAKDLLFRQVGLEDHHSLRYPATQTNKSSSVDIDQTILDPNIEGGYRVLLDRTIPCKTPKTSMEVKVPWGQVFPSGLVLHDPHEDPTGNLMLICARHNSHTE